jgi:hypothetical protein
VQRLGRHELTGPLDDGVRFDRGGLGQQQRELVTADTPEHVLRAHD